MHALMSNFSFDCIKPTLVFLLTYTGLHRETEAKREGGEDLKRENCRPPHGHIRIAYT